MKVVFFGTPQFAVPVLETLFKHHNVVAVVTAPDKKVGRKQILTPSPVKQFALANKIKVLHPQMENGKWKMENLEAHLYIIAAYGKIIPKQILDIPHYGAINIHPSPLPQYRGPSPITATILNGDKTSAISFMKLDEQMDHGPILKIIPYDVPDDTTSQSLTYDMFRKGAEFLPHVIDDYVTGKIKPISQKHEDATYTHIITKQDGYIDLDSPPEKEQLDRMIRAYYPWPAVWGKVRIKKQEVRIKFLPSYVCHPEFISGSPEIPKQVRNDKGFCIQLEGKKPMPIKDFLNGYPELREKLQNVL